MKQDAEPSRHRVEADIFIRTESPAAAPAKKSHLRAPASFHRSSAQTDHVAKKRLYQDGIGLG
jgi:hypothetical protein